MTSLPAPVGPSKSTDPFAAAIVATDRRHARVTSDRPWISGTSSVLSGEDGKRSWLGSSSTTINVSPTDTTCPGTIAVLPVSFLPSTNVPFRLPRSSMA